MLARSWTGLATKVTTALTISMMCQAPALAAPGAWRVTQTQAALTGKVVFVAALQSDNLLLNQIGRPENAQFIIRCEEGVLRSYFAWPTVIESDFVTPFFNVPQTQAYLRVDDGKIFESDVDISDDGAAAGKYATASTRKWLDHFAKANKVVVRIRGSLGGAQDAVFDTVGLDDVETGALVACGLAPGPMPTFASIPAPPAPATRRAPLSDPAGPIGLLTAPSTPQALAGLGLPPTPGVLVIVVMPRSAAERAGLAIMDVVDQFDGMPIIVPSQLTDAIKAVPPGKAVKVHLYRGGSSKDLMVQF